MTISRRSWRCLSRRALARISIIVMFGESSMNSGEDDTSPILRASRVQSSSFMLPLRMWLSGIFASADSSRMVISLRVISREKITLVMLWWIDADRQKSRPSVDFPMAGRPATITIWPGVQAVGELVEVGEAGRDADHLAVAVVDRLDLVERRTP